MSQKLTPKQSAFVDEYLIDLNATQAAIRAGYSKKTATETGYENLTKPHLAEAIQQAIKKRSEKTKIDAEWVLINFKKLYERCSEAEPVFDSEGNETGVFKFDGANANRALENIGKHTDVKAFADKKEADNEKTMADAMLEIAKRLPD